MYGWRRFLLRAFGAKIGKGVIIRPSVRITYPWKLTIGDYSWIGDNVDLYNLGNITIGAHAVVSQRSYLCTGSHDYKKEGFDIYSESIIIEDEAWVATDVFIAPGVIVGAGTVIGARSVVLDNMPKGMVCFGYPAKPLKKRIMNQKK
jgi:putative colanic acid biosynthesis acetyltransferase WcaF